MHVEIVLAALVMVVAVLVAADFFRRTSDAPHEFPAGNEPGPALDADRETYPVSASRAGSASFHSSSLPYEPAAASPPATRTSPPAAGTSPPAAGTSPPATRTPGPSPDPGGPRTNW